MGVSGKSDPASGKNRTSVERKSERELQSIGPRLRLVTDSNQLELLLESLRHTFDHVRDESAAQAMKRLVHVFVRRALDQNLAVLERHLGNETVAVLVERLAVHVAHVRKRRRWIWQRGFGMLEA